VFFLFFSEKMREIEITRVLISERAKSHGNCADFKSSSYNIMNTHTEEETLCQTKSRKAVVKPDFPTT
jgi:hypothetical protein